jgi:adenosine deaminase
MKHWEKGKKEHRRTEERDYHQESNKRRKLKPVEKSKYRLRSVNQTEDDE